MDMTQNNLLFTILILYLPYRQTQKVTTFSWAHPKIVLNILNL